MTGKTRYGKMIARTAMVGGAVLTAFAGVLYADPNHKGAEAGKKGGAHEDAGVRLEVPKMDSERGMRLFASKGCVACHNVNGVGGHDATPLDAHTMKKVMNPFDFTAKMWRMAPAMIAAQEEAMEGQILFTGDEIADIVAFVHDDKQQHKFNETMIPPGIVKLMDHGHGGKPAHQKSIGHGMKGMKPK